MLPRDPAIDASYTERIGFVVELAERLHAYGTTAQRLEGAIESVAKRIGLECEPWVNPTGMILAFSDPARPPGESDTTRVIRVGLGDTDLYKLCEADRIAEDVMAGRMQIAEGRVAFRALARGTGWRGRAMQLLGFGLASAAVAGLLRLPWLDIGTAGVIGLLIGLVDIA
ncbi:MAG TPA: threonine/serine exporter family protein, partial [Thermomonas sp.]|nr:threonine/serine exporter family protein [Thermomonas sp.]